MTFHTIYEDVDEAAACMAEMATHCTLIGALHYLGVSTEQDLATAAKFFRKACDGGNMVSCNNLGWQYFNELGVGVDLHRALGLFDQACAGGNNQGCSNAEIARERLNATGQ